MNPNDLVLFGFILHVSNFNELEKFGAGSENWKTIHTVLSVIFAAIYIGLFVAQVYAEFSMGKINHTAIIGIGSVLGFVSIVLSFAVYYGSIRWVAR